MSLSVSIARRRSLQVVASVLLVGSAVGCSRNSAPNAGGPPAPVAAAGPAQPAAAKAADPAAAVSARKIIRKADVGFEVSSVGAVSDQVTRLVERRGGFVASSTSESQGRAGEADVVTLSLRVPAASFIATLDELRRLSSGNGSEQIGSEDVSEEYVDLEARLANQRALEQRFLDILKRADKIEDALRVEHELASVRTEIDRMEGRRRFLEHEVALATISLTLRKARPLVSVSSSDFGAAIETAGSDAIDLGAGIVVSGVRAIGVLLPLTVLLGLPGFFCLRWLRRRRARLLVA
jgi:hypothetical protein